MSEQYQAEVNKRKLDKKLLKAALIGSLFFIEVANAQDSQRGTFSFLVENDSIANEDRHYTSGIQFSYLSSPDGARSWLENIGRIFPGINESEAIIAGIQIGHSIFTPNDIRATEPLPNDRPYAGLFHAGLAFVSESESDVDSWLIDFGQVGPKAKGERIQNDVHEAIGSDLALGWDNQIENKLTTSVVYEHRWKNLWQSEMSGFGIDLNPHFGFSLGDLMTYANLGITLRFGNDLGNDLAPPRIRPSLPGSSYFAPRDTFAWYLFLGTDARVVGYNRLLEGDTLVGDNTIDPEDYVIDGQAGLVLMVAGARLTFSYVQRSEEFKQQLEPDRFGSISLSFKL